MRSNSPARIPARPVFRLLEAALLLVSLLLLALHYVHLTADFPANTPWMDWAKYTDEGWYGDAAIRLLTLGHWRVPGDFNPAAALPVWPTLELLLFRVTGVSLSAARALSVSVFALSAIVTALLVRDALCRIARLQGRPTRLPDLFALLTLALLSTSAFCFAFSRMAILEPLLVLLGLLALHLSIRLGQLPSHRPRALLLGLLLVLMVLTKTTGLFLTPAIFLALWASAGWSLRRALPPALLAVGTATGLWLAYFLAVVHPHFLIDYRYLFSANAYTGITRATALTVLADTFRDITWIGIAPALAALAALPFLLALPRLRRDPLAPALLLWLLGYLFFLAYHANLQPRYYFVLAAPLLALPPLALGALALLSPAAPSGRELLPPLRNNLPHLLTALGTVTLLVIAAAESAFTLHLVRHPSYQFLAAARGVAAIINSDPHHQHLLLSISGSDISLMTGVPSICDDFGTAELEDRTDHYHPGWYAAWNRIDDDKMDALTPQFHVERVATFPAYDDPERNLLILYRLDTPGELRARRHHPRRSIPRRLQTRTGQQPSPDQLQH